MITVKEVVVPTTKEAAYEALQSNRFATLLGGGAFLRMGSKNITKLIDLSQCGLNQIEERDDAWHLGAMVTLGELERHPGLNRDCSWIFSESVKNIVGVQLRNVVTLGGTVYSRYGFSDLITGLLALPARVNLHKGGTMPLEQFLEEGTEGRDLLVAVVVPKGRYKAATTSLRQSEGDYAVLNAAACHFDHQWRICLGARPGRAKLAEQAMKHLQGKTVTDALLEEATDLATEEMVFGTNFRGSKEYRREMARVLVKRVLKEVAFDETEHSH